MTSAPLRSTDPPPNGSKRNVRPAKPSAMPPYASRGQASPERDAVEQRHPDRDRPDEERRDACGHRLLRPRERSVARDEEEAAEDERREDLRPPDPVASRSPRGSAHDEQHAACDEVPDRHREERRQVTDGDRERDERRAPDDVHGHEGEPDPHVATRTHAPMVPARDPSAQVRLSRPAPSRRADVAPSFVRARRSGNAEVRYAPLESSVPCRVSSRRHLGACHAAGRTWPSSSSSGSGSTSLYQIARGAADRSVAARVPKRRVGAPHRAAPRHAVRAGGPARRRHLVDPDHADLVHVLAVAVRRRRRDAAVGLLPAPRALRAASATG